MTEWLETARDAVVVLGGLIGLAVGAYQYKNWRQGNVILKMTMDVRQFTRGSQTLLDIEIRITNVGKVAAFVMPKQSPMARCFARRIPEEIAPESALTWEALSGQDIVEPIEYMEDWFRPGPEMLYPESPMEFEPGVADDFRVFIKTGFEGFVWLRADFVDNTETAWSVDRMILVGATQQPHAVDGNRTSIYE